MQNYMFLQVFLISETLRDHLRKDLGGQRDCSRLRRSSLAGARDHRRQSAPISFAAAARRTRRKPSDSFKVLERVRRASELGNSYQEKRKAQDDSQYPRDNRPPFC